MNSAQKVIKYLAIAFAVFIIGVIFSTIISVGMVVGRIFDHRDYSSGDWSEVASIGDLEEYADFSGLKLELKATSLRVERGEKFEILADNTDVKVRRDGNRLIISEDREWLDWFDHGGLLKIRLPEGKNLEVFELDAGAGKVEIDGLKVKKLDLELGAGRVDLQNIVATDSAKVNGGAGYLSLSGSELKNLDLDMGAGKVEVEAKLIGRADIDAGVGHLVLNLYGREEDYSVRVDKGLGAVKYNGRNVDDSTQGSGATEIKIDGGVGAIDITTQNR